MKISARTASFYILSVLLVAAVSAGIALLVAKNRSGSPGVEVLLPTTTPTPELKVYISGAVAAPGVYTLKEGDRLVDVIAIAGGATQDARLSCVNLATRVEDETHYHVPGTQEPCEAPSGPASSSVGDGRIDLNTASADQLETLPGIGPTRALAIVDYRERNGPFKSAEAIMDVSGIGPATYQNIRDLITVGSGSR